MPNKRDIYSKKISTPKYRELLYFCMQYKEKKQEAPEHCKLIEDTARAVDEAIAPYLLKNITEGITFEYLGVPCGRRQFYEKRQQFFFELSKKR